MTTTIDPPKMTPTRVAYLEKRRQEKNAKCRDRARARRAVEKAEREAELAGVPIPARNKTTRLASRKHDTHARGVTYVKDPAQTSTDLKQFGIWRGDDTVIQGTIPTGEPKPPSPKPSTMRDGAGNIIADKWQRPIEY